MSAVSVESNLHHQNDRVLGMSRVHGGGDGAGMDLEPVTMNAKKQHGVEAMRSVDEIASIQFVDAVRRTLRDPDDESLYHEFCRVVHTGQLQELELILQQFPDLLEAAVRLTQDGWVFVREQTHADNAMGYIRRVAECCPQEVYAEFLGAIRGAMSGIPVEDVYMRIAQLFGMMPHTPQRRDLLHEFFVCHMPQEARDNVIALRREQFPSLDLLASTAVQHERAE
jgi:hypothetical protein